MSKQMILATLCLTAGSALVLTGCQTKAEAAAARQQQQAAEIVSAEEQLAEKEIVTEPVVITPAETVPAEPTPADVTVAETAPVTPAPAPVHPKPVAYTVTAGDSVSALATRFNVRTPDILALNPALRDNPNNLRIGQTVLFPAGTDVTVAPKPRKVTPAATAFKNQVVYEVRPGDVLGGIAIRHKVSVDAIRKANNIKKDMIWVGQKLVIPGATKAVPPAKKTTVKKVEPKPTAKPAEKPAPAVESVPPPPAPEETTIPDAVLPPPAPEGEALLPLDPPAAPEAPAETVTTYTVGEGEDLVSISLRWGVSLPALREANGLDASSNAVAPGTTLKIPMVNP